MLIELTLLVLPFGLLCLLLFFSRQVARKRIPDESVVTLRKSMRASGLSFGLVWIASLFGIWNRRAQPEELLLILSLTSAFLLAGCVLSLSAAGALRRQEQNDLRSGPNQQPTA